MDGGVTSNELQMIRDALRANLESNWPTEKAVALSEKPEELTAIWRALGQQGVLSLGAGPEGAGLSEALVVMEELGRAGCPVPMVAAIVANLIASEAPAFVPAIERMQRGEAQLAIAFADYENDPGAGELHIKDGLLHGHVAFVEGVPSAAHLLSFANGPAAVLVGLDDASATAAPTPGLSRPTLYEIAFKGAKAVAVPLAESRVADLNLVSRLAYVARALGAAERSFELAVDYAKVREQFNQPIGRFQAIQHKLADCQIALHGVRAALDAAAASFDSGDRHWRMVAASACAFASAALRKVSLETHHAFGAIGYSEEHEAPRHFRRVHSDVSRLGGVRRAREELAEYFLGDSPGRFPESDLGEAGNAFREEVRAWLGENWSEARRNDFIRHQEENHRHDEIYMKALGETGWLGLSWPTRFGGQARGPLEHLAYREEVARAGAPHAGAAQVQARAVMEYGTVEQQQKFLPGILRGELNFGMGYSEPGSGSDLASLRTRAVREGEEWVINGQKIWTSGYWCEYMWLAARTDPEAKPKNAGISMFMVPMDTPGITVRPMQALYGGYFANVFYDNVRVPANALVGPLNGGWKVLIDSLADERVLISGFIAEFAVSFEGLCDYLRGTPLARDSATRQTIGALAAELEVGRRLLLNVVTMAEKGMPPVHEAAIAKVFSAEFAERFCESALDILGMSATLGFGVSGARPDGRLEQMLREGPRWVIHLGTNEIQRNIIAQQGLRLPR